MSAATNRWAGAACRIDTLFRTVRGRARSAACWLAAYWPGRRTVLMTAGMTLLFLLAGAELASADDGSDNETGGILAPLNVQSSEGAPLDAYDLKSESGGATDIQSHVCNLLIGGGFALVRLLVGLICWVTHWVFNFPIVSTLISTAQALNTRFFTLMGSDLSLYALFLAGAFAFGLILVMRGKVGRGFGEIALTLVICTAVTMPALSARSMLGPQGPLAQSQQAAHEVGQMTANVNGVDPGCTSPQDKDDPSCPMRVVLTRTLVVQPYQLLQYGQIPAKGSWLADVHNRWIHGQIQGSKGNCGDVLPLPGSDSYCGNCVLCSQGDSSWDELKKELGSHGKEGKDIENFAVNSDWDRVGGVALVLLAVLIVAIVVLGMALIHLGCQFADVIAATMTPVALIWAMLPGGNRSAVWKWLGIFMTGAVSEFAISVMLPLFALGADGILNSNQQTVMIQRLFILDGFALVVLVFHRRIFAAAGRVGDRFAARMRYARVGGSAMSGEESRLGLAMSQAMGTLSPGGGFGGAGAGGGLGLGFGGGLFGGGSLAHAAMLRRARIADGLGALADPGLGSMSAGTMVAGTAGELRRGLSALALPGRAAHHLLVGSPLSPEQLAKRMKPEGGKGPMVVDGKTGEVLHDPKDDLTPFGHTVHNRLLGTRVGRLAIRAGQAGKLGFDATVGLPASWERMHRAKDRVWNRIDKQAAHYGGVAKSWWGDEKAGLKDWAGDVKTAGKFAKGSYNTVKSGYNNAYYAAATLGRVHGQDLAGPLVAAHLLHGVDVTDTEAAVPERPRYSHFGEPWEHARERGDEYPFYEVGPDTAIEAVLHAGRAAEPRPDESDDAERVVFRSSEGDTGPADLRGALGPGVIVSPSTIVTDEGMVVDPSTGEILAESVPETSAAMAPEVLRRVSPAVLREPSGTSLEALRMRRELGYARSSAEDASSLDEHARKFVENGGVWVDLSGAEPRFIEREDL
ncbi:hypothetical protein LN042_23220 [Kitasatospora sp. RB6PN24]|uniref:hypothetical protein n=1 Tax=Kitasatospora humi TaxID=2893891 RepID=UPI001E38198C|nr:hypothetical protein [Kitasatospora humi]MCC9309948.1 hypothetical protein [Kitasatospora humi]